MSVNHTCIRVLTIALIATLLNSCATYTIPREEFYTMLHDASPIPVATSHSAAINIQRYTSNGVKEITCYDKSGKKVVFANSPKVEMRITDKKNHKHIFYFDTVLLKDSVFTGMNSRLLATYKSISYPDIKKVEVQKGAKAYHYAASK